MPHQGTRGRRDSDRQISLINLSDAERLLSMVVGGALGILGWRRSGTSGIAIAAAGAGFLFRGISGFSPLGALLGRDTSARARALRPLDLQTTVTVNASREEVAAFWRHVENLPLFMRHLAEVRQVGEGRSHWVASVPGGLGTIAWDAEMRTEGDRISWRSVPGSVIENTGEVRFREAPGARGTEVHARISYRPPAGRVGRATSNLLTPVFNQMVKEDIRRFKNVMEAGEVPTAKAP